MLGSLHIIVMNVYMLEPIGEENQLRCGMQIRYRQRFR